MHDATATSIGNKPMPTAQANDLPMILAVLRDAAELPRLLGFADSKGQSYDARSKI